MRSKLGLGLGFWLGSGASTGVLDVLSSGDVFHYQGADFSWQGADFYWD